MTTRITRHLGPPSTWIFIQSCPGREAFLDNTLHSLHEQGGRPKSHRPVVVCFDGRVAESRDDCVSVSLWPFSGASRGNLAAFHATLKFSLSVAQPRDYILFFEDDISFAKNAVARMLEIGVPEGCAFTSFFDMKEFFPGMPYGLYRVPLSGVDGRGFWGLQAVLLTYKTVKTFVNSPLVIERMEKLKNHSDMVLMEVLQEACKEEGSKGTGGGCDAYAAHVPSLVEHEGADRSSIWKFTREETSSPIPGDHEINRRATNPCPPGLDALTLPQYR